MKWLIIWLILMFMYMQIFRAAAEEDRWYEENKWVEEENEEI